MTKSQGIIRMDAKKLAENIGMALNTANVSYTVCGALRREISLYVPILPIVVSDLFTAHLTVLSFYGDKGMELPKQTQKLRHSVRILDLPPIPIDLFHAYPEEWGAMMLHLTGNHFFIIQMRSIAKQDGMKLNQYGLWHNENIVAGKTEEQIFEALGIDFIPPEYRELGPRQKLSEIIVRRM